MAKTALYYLGVRMFNMAQLKTAFLVDLVAMDPSWRVIKTQVLGAQALSFLSWVGIQYGPFALSYLTTSTEEIIWSRLLSFIELRTKPVWVDVPSSALYSYILPNVYQEKGETPAVALPLDLFLAYEREGILFTAEGTIVFDGYDVPAKRIENPSLRWVCQSLAGATTVAAREHETMRNFSYDVLSRWAHGFLVRVTEEELQKEGLLHLQVVFSSIESIAQMRWILRQWPSMTGFSFSLRPWQQEGIPLNFWQEPRKTKRGTWKRRKNS